MVGVMLNVVLSALSSIALIHKYLVPVISVPIAFANVTDAKPFSPATSVNVPDSASVNESLLDDK